MRGVKHFAWLFVAPGLMLGASCSAAELPTKLAKPKPAAKAEKCEIDGQPGFRVAGSDTCLRISGYVSAGVAAKAANSH